MPEAASPSAGRSDSCVRSPVAKSFTPDCFKPVSLKDLTKPSVGGPDGRNAKTPWAPASRTRCMIGLNSVVLSGMRIDSTTSPPAAVMAFLKAASASTPGP